MLQVGQSIQEVFQYNSIDNKSIDKQDKGLQLIKYNLADFNATKMDQYRQDETNTTNTSSSQMDNYIPSWRAACDTWVTNCVIENKDVNTPVYQLYNAYIKDNPEHYMDIGQFGKVLRSRFPYRKRRRGKQGQQVYVYQGIALKEDEEALSSNAVLSSPPQMPENRDCFSPEQDSSALSMPFIASDMVIGMNNSTGGRLLTSPLNSSRHLDMYSPCSVGGLSDTGSEGTYSDSGISLSKRKESDADEDSILLSKRAKNITAEQDDKYSNASLCRMAIGRRWIDTHLVDTPGVHTYAQDISNAYAEDHPDEPLNFTSLALLIRGKFPGRRKVVNVKGNSKYLYKNLKLLKSDNLETQTEADMVTEEDTFSLLEQPTLTTFYGSSPASPTKNHNKSTKPKPRKILPSTYLPSQMNTNVTTISDSGSSQMPYILIPIVSYNNSNQATDNVKVVQADMAAIQEIKPKNVISEKNSIKNSRKLVYGEQLPPKMLLKQTNEAMDVNDFLEREISEINDFDSISKTLDYKLKIQMPSSMPNASFESDPYVVQNVFSAPENKNYDKKTDRTIKNTSKIAKQLYNDNRISSTKMYAGLPYEKPITFEDKPVYKGNQQNSPPYDYLSMTSDHSTYSYENENNPAERDYNSQRILEVKNRQPYQLTFSYPTVNNERIALSSNLYNDLPQDAPLNLTIASNNPISESNEFSNYYDFHDSNGSPTSTQPPCPAMYRLAEEIDNTVPNVYPMSSSVPVSSYLGRNYLSTIDNDISLEKHSNILYNNPIFNSIGNEVKECLHGNNSFNEEYSIINENPAVSYSNELVSAHDEMDVDKYSCSVSKSLEDIESSPPEEIDKLLRNHQSCSGKGCDEQCKILQAAFIHLSKFHHKCPIYHSFINIIGKHSKRCRVIRCGVEFCQFVKHELHQNGTKILPLQLLKERHILEEDFKICEQIASHNGYLHCHRMQSSTLPVSDTSAMSHKKFIEPSVKKDYSMELDNFSLALPDNSKGNAVSAHLSRELGLVKSNAGVR